MSLKVGITGGIGSGKTIVCKVFELLGIPVFYADDEAKSLMINDKNLVENIKKAFGDEAYLDNQTIDRKYISNLVFNNPNELKKLNNLVHPAVFAAFDNWASQQKSPYVLKEAALLFESDSYLKNYKNILVSCPLDLRISRVMKRDETTNDKVLERIATQFSEEKKLALADYIINNNEQEFIIPQVLKLHQLLMKVATK